MNCHEGMNTSHLTHSFFAIAFKQLVALKTLEGNETMEKNEQKANNEERKLNKRHNFFCCLHFPRTTYSFHHFPQTTHSFFTQSTHFSFLHHSSIELHSTVRSFTSLIPTHSPLLLHSHSLSLPLPPSFSLTLLRWSKSPPTATLSPKATSPATTAST